MPVLILVAIAAVIYAIRIQAPGEELAPVRPLLEIDFPETGESGSVQTAVLTIENPSVMPIELLFVNFVDVGVAGGEGIPQPIVFAATRRTSPVIDVDPEARTVGQGVRFGFGPLEPGATTTIEFELRLPETAGAAANSVQVYDGRDPQRAAGAKLEILVTG